MFVPLRKAVEMLGLHPNTLRKYADEGKIKSIKNEAGQRLYDVQSYISGATRDSVLDSVAHGGNPKTALSRLFAIAESQVKSKETTSTDKLTSWVHSTQTQKLSKISEAGLTSKEKGLEPYWTDYCKEISSQLLLPIETDCADLDSSLYNTWSNKTVDESWFSTKLYTVPNLNLQPICSQYFTSSLVESTDLENTRLKSKKIRIHLTTEQKKKIKHWFGVSRFVFNQTVKYLQEPGTKANWKAIKTGIINNLPEWAKEVPYQIKSIAIKDACIAVKNA